MNEQGGVFSFIRSHVDILDAVGRYISLKPAGRYFKGLSPFKTEKTASFTVSPDKKIFYCFSTGIGGDVIDFVSRMERCTQWEAAKMLADQYKLSLPISNHTSDESEKNSVVKETYFKVNAFFAQWSARNIKKATEAFNYILQRGITSATIDFFSIGYCPAGDQGVSALIIDARRENILVDDLCSAGILVLHTERKYNKNEKYYIPYEDRIIFPINDISGRCVGFGSRIFRTHDSRAKYYNTAGNQDFLKKKMLYGFDKARNFIHESNEVFLVEGYFDVIALWQSGYKNVVATLGTACTEDHLIVLERHAKRIIAMYDGDQAGQGALLRVTKMCWKRLFELFVVTLPNGDDPASIINRNEPIKNYIDAKKSGIEFFAHALLNGFETISLKEQAERLDEIIQCISDLDDPVKQGLFLRDLSAITHISQNLLLRQLKSKHQKPENIIPVSAPSLTTFFEENDEIIELCTRLLLGYLECKGKGDCCSDAFTLIMEYGNESHTKVLQAYQLASDEKKEDYMSFFAILKDDEKNILLASFLQQENFHSHMLSTLCRILKQKLWKKAVKKCREKMLLENHDGKSAGYIETYAELKKLKEKLGQ